MIFLSNFDKIKRSTYNINQQWVKNCKKSRFNNNNTKKQKSTDSTRLQNRSTPTNTPGLQYLSLTQNAVVYLGHLPHGFYEEQLKSYFSQYGEVLAVKVARSRKTARSKGYAFVQFKYPEVADIVSDTMNGYLLMGKVIVSHSLPSSSKNPFAYSSSGQYKFINWKRMFIQQTNEVPFLQFSLKPRSKQLTS